MNSKITAIIISLFMIIGSAIFVYCLPPSHEDIAVTIVAKSDGVKSHYKSTKVRTQYLFAFHPDDPKYDDFDMEVPLAKYIKYNVGDRLILKDKEINNYLKESSVFTDIVFWNVMGAFIGILGLSFLCFSISAKIENK